MWCAELDPDGGVTDQVYFATRVEADDFCKFMNGNTEGVGMSALWYWYEFEIPDPMKKCTRCKKEEDL